MPLDPFLHELSALQQIDSDVVGWAQILTTYFQQLAALTTSGAAKTQIDNLDVSLSSRASEVTLAALLALGRGTHAIDTGNVAILAAGASPLVATFKASSLFAVNLTDVVALFTVQDGVGHLYLSATPIPPRGFLSIPYGGMTFSGGLTWSADVDGAIRAQMVGD